MFGLIKRSTHEAAMAGVAAMGDNLARAQAKAARLEEENTCLALKLADKTRELRTVGAALNEVIAERDALRDAAAAKRAKQLANLTAANARRRAAAEQKRATH